jgi:hypothetical protein
VKKGRNRMKQNEGRWEQSVVGCRVVNKGKDNQGSSKDQREWRQRRMKGITECRRVRKSGEERIMIKQTSGKTSFTNGHPLVETCFTLSTICHINRIFGDY